MDECLFVFRFWYFTVQCNCQIVTYVEDFENERKDRERLIAVCDKQRRDIEVLLAEKSSDLQKVSDTEFFHYLFKIVELLMLCWTAIHLCDCIVLMIQTKFVFVLKICTNNLHQQ